MFYSSVCVSVHTCVRECMCYRGQVEHLSDLPMFGDQVSLCSPGYPGTHFVDQVGLKLIDLSASVTQVVGLKVTIWCYFLKNVYF